MSKSVVGALCSGQTSCSIPAGNSEFGGDPCYSTDKRLAVEMSYVALPTAEPTSSPSIYLPFPTVKSFPSGVPSGSPSSISLDSPSGVPTGFPVITYSVTPTRAPSFTSKILIVCGEVAENDYLTLSAPLGYALGEVLFASYGNPAGSCGAYSVGSCDSVMSKSVVGALCSGQTSCSIPAGNSEFGGDPCYSTDKHLAVEMSYVALPTAEPTSTPSIYLPFPTINSFPSGVPSGSPSSISLDSPSGVPTGFPLITYSVTPTRAISFRPILKTPTQKSLSVEICYESASPTASPSVSTTITPSTTTEPPILTNCTSLCGEVAENDYLTLSAPLGYALGEVLFASYGNPFGSCGAYSVGSCDAAMSKSVVDALCSGQTSCSIPAGNSEFGGDPCYSTDKRLAVEMCLSSVNLPTSPSNIPTQLPTTLLAAPTIPPASDGGYLCGEVTENDYLILTAPVGSILGDVVFASFGTPSGSCGSYNISSCNSPSSVAVVSSYCTGHATCSIPAGNTEFGDDSCYSQLKQLFVEIRYDILPSSEPTVLPTVGQVTSLPTSSVYFGPTTVPSNPGKGSYYPSSVPTGFPSDYEGGHPS
eukprot:gene1732-2032_t